MIDLVSKRFGRLVVLKRHGSDRAKNATWLCRCDCGLEKVISGSYLRTGETKSCGCLHSERTRELMSSHGQSKTRLYKVWAGIKSRCYNCNADNYKYYGGSGITMCDNWKNSFQDFYKWSVENGYDPDAKPQECTIDRIDNSRAYCPENCRWVNHITQCNNQSSNKTFVHNGERLTMAETARKFGINYSTLRARILHGKSFEDAIQ